MKKSDLFKIGVLLMATTLGTTGCSFGEDEKKPEIVVDPAEKTIEYYIAGKVTEGTTALSGVEVKAGEVTATTDAEGAYKLTVDSKKVYTVTFSKEGYMSIDNATATIADNAANRSMVSLSVKLSKKAPEKEVKADAEEEVVVTDKGDSNISQAEAAVIIPPKAIETTTTVSVTPYEEPAAVTTTVTPGNNVETPVAIANIEVETAKEVTLAKPVTLAIINKASEHTTFENVEVYNQKTTTRAGENWNKVADAIYDSETNSYKFTLPAGASLSGKYSMRVKSSKTTGKELVGETNKEEKKSNEGNMTAIPEYKINFEATAGWEYTVIPFICASYVSLSLHTLFSSLFSCCMYFSVISVSDTPVWGFMFAFLSFNSGNTLSHLYSLAGSSNPEMKKMNTSVNNPIIKNKLS